MQILSSSYSLSWSFYRLCLQIFISLHSWRWITCCLHCQNSSWLHHQRCWIYHRHQSSSICRLHRQNSPYLSSLSHSFFSFYRHQNLCSLHRSRNFCSLHCSHKFYRLRRYQNFRRLHRHQNYQTCHALPFEPVELPPLPASSERVEGDPSLPHGLPLPLLSEQEHPPSTPLLRLRHWSHRPLLHHKPQPIKLLLCYCPAFGRQPPGHPPYHRPSRGLHPGRLPDRRPFNRLRPDRLPDRCPLNRHHPICLAALHGHTQKDYPINTNGN